MSSEASRFRFSLKQALVTTSFLAAAFAMGPIFAAVAIVLVVILLIGRWPTLEFVLFVGSTIVLVLASLPSDNSQFRRPRKKSCTNNQRQIMVALWNYESAYGQFPPAGNELGENGLAHSWRVRILPFIEELNLYNQYDFNEPWDGPNNRKLVSQMPECFRCTFNPRLESGETAYKLIIGPGSLFDGVGLPTTARIKDGTSSTIAIIEDAQPVNWMKPEDVTIDQAVARLTSSDLRDAPHVRRTELYEYWERSRCIHWDGGSDRGLPTPTDHEDYRKMFGIDDGIVPDSRLDDHRLIYRRTRHETWVRNGIFWILFIAIFLVYPPPGKDSSTAQPSIEPGNGSG